MLGHGLGAVADADNRPGDGFSQPERGERRPGARLAELNNLAGNYI